MQIRYRKMIVFFWIACQVVVFSLLFPTHVYADDCLSDPLNAADCMRTPGFRQVVAVTISLGGTLATILVTTLGGAATATDQSASGGFAAGAFASATTGAVPPAPAAATTSAAPAAPAATTTPAATTPGGESPSAAGIQETVEGGLLTVKQSTLWDASTSILGDTSSMIGAISEYVNFKDSAETIQKIRDSVQAWRNNPSAGAAAEYLKNLRGTTNLRVQRLAGTLGVVGQVVDVTDAVMTGLKTAQERGYTGMDKVLTVGAEVVKKDLVWLLTKNPAVGLTDFVVGKVTTYAWGKDKNWSIGNTIDRGSKAWDEKTNEYAGYTGGALFAPTNKEFGASLPNDPEIRQKDQYLHGIHQIKKLVSQGEISLQEGGARIRRLRDALPGGQ